MLHFELFMINNVPEPVKQFVMSNLFQRNQNHNNQDTGQGIDYKLEEYNKLFKHFEVSSSPSIEEWTKVASGIYSEPGAPDYNSRVESCRKSLEESTIIKAGSSKSLKNLDGKTTKQEEAFDFEKEFKRRKND